VLAVRFVQLVSSYTRSYRSSLPLTLDTNPHPLAHQSWFSKCAFLKFFLRRYAEEDEEAEVEVPVLEELQAELQVAELEAEEAAEAEEAEAEADAEAELTAEDEAEAEAELEAEELEIRFAGVQRPQTGRATPRPRGGAVQVELNS
jgi:hypothetical protein